nr:PREDICTED: uncharacterized protein LOC102688469 [Lepisosteus oculatus]
MPLYRSLSANKHFTALGQVTTKLNGTRANPLPPAQFLLDSRKSDPKHLYVGDPSPLLPALQDTESHLRRSSSSARRRKRGGRAVCRSQPGSGEELEPVVLYMRPGQDRAEMSPPPQQEEMSEPPVAAVGLLSYETLVHAVAGAVGSATAMSVFFPLDTARIRLQVDEHRKSRSTPVILAEIAKEEGVPALYRGWFPVISSLCCSNFVYFYTFNTLKALWALERGRSRPGRDLLMGFISGAVNVLLTTPMWVVNTRLKLQGARFRNEELQQTHYKGIFDAFSQIAAREGLGALWNGTLPSLLLVFNPAVQFMFYEAMKRRAGRGRRKVRGPLARPCQLQALPLDPEPQARRGKSGSFDPLGNAAGMKTRVRTSHGPWEPSSCCLLHHPANATPTMRHHQRHTTALGQRDPELAFIEIDDDDDGDDESIRGVPPALPYLPLPPLPRRLSSKQGVAGLYKGLEAKLLQTVLTAALMFVVYEKITAVTFKVMGLSRKVRR